MESAHQTVYDYILYITWRSVFIRIQAYQYSNIISYHLNLAYICYDRWQPYQVWVLIMWWKQLVHRPSLFCIWGLDLRLNNINHYLSSLLTSILIFVRRGSHQGGSPQNGLGDGWTCGMTLASAYVLHRLSATWSQLQMKERKSEWKWVLIGVSLLNTGDRVQ